MEHNLTPNAELIKEILRLNKRLAAYEVAIKNLPSMCEELADRLEKDTPDGQ